MSSGNTFPVCWTNEWMDGWIDGWVDGQTEWKSLVPSVPISSISIPKIKTLGWIYLLNFNDTLLLLNNGPIGTLTGGISLTSYKNRKQQVSHFLS